MINPKEEIRTYLGRLVNSFLYVKTLNRQLSVLKQWESESRFQTIRSGSHHFALVSYSFQRTLLIELYKLVSDREQKSIVDFLRKAKQHAASVQPREYDPTLSKDRDVDPSDFSRVVRSQMDTLTNKKDLIHRLEDRRDKFTHADASVFNDPVSIFTKYPIDSSEIDELIDIVADILRVHYAYLFSTDLYLQEVITATGTNTVLRHLRAFNRIWDDDRLANLRRDLYLSDNYDETCPVFFQ
jgi:hypothetical protein